LQELSTTLKTEPGKLYPIKCDITKETDVKDAFKWVKSNLGGVDILINNAGCDSSNTLIGKSQKETDNASYSSLTKSKFRSGPFFHVSI